MHLSEGTLLMGGRYRIEKVLGQGGFGITYLAEQVSLGRKVVVKEFFMKEHCNRDSDTSHVSAPSLGSRELVERFRQKFVKEARSIATFSNAHIISIIDIFEENGTAYYVMEYLSGDSLSAKVARQGKLNERDAVRFTRHIADALSEVHSHNLLHLDVKPANIMFNGKGEAVLIDFGISKHYDEGGQQTSSALVGISEGYAPLEQYEAGALDCFTPGTDIYALGATLYFMLTGERPPKASDVMNDGLPELPANISSPVRRAVEAAMQPRRKNRPQSIGEFLEIVESGEVKDESGKMKDERGEMKDNSDGIDDCPPALRGTSAAEGVNDSPATDDGETVVGNPSGSCHPERSEPSVDARRGQSQGSYKHANREILPPSGRQNDNGGEMKDERKGLGGTSKKKWAIIIAVLVIGAAAALFGTMSGGGSSNDYEGKLVPILDNSNDKWGYADTLGNIVVEPQYDYAYSFSEGLASVNNGNYGFIDKTGKQVIPCIYEDASDFSDGLARVDKDGKYGFIDKTGKVVVEPQYNWIDHFYEGLAQVDKDGKYGFIDKTGKVVVEPQYDYMHSFKDGLAMVEKNGKYGFIDKTGRVVIGLQYDYAGSFSEGLAAVHKDGKCGFIDKTGRVVIEPQYDRAYSFSEGLAAVHKDGKSGFIDKTGRVVIGLQYDSAGSFSEGLAWVYKDGKEFCIDKTGREYIKW